MSIPATLTLADFLSTTPLFQAVDKLVLLLLAEQCTAYPVPAQQTIIREGDRGDSLFIIQSGRLEVFLKDAGGKEVFVATLHPGDSVGEMALLTGAIRSATVRTAEPCHLWQLSRASFAQVADQEPRLRAALERAIVAHLHRANLRSALYANRLLGTLTDPALRDLEQELDLVSLKNGETLLTQGDPSDALYLVIHGRLRVVDIDAAGQELVVEELGRGQVVGEMGLLTGKPRRATIYAVRDTLLGRLPADAFFRLLQKHPQPLTHLFAANILTELWDKTRGTKRRQNRLGAIAVVAIGPDVPLVEFAEQLTQALCAYGSARYISNRIVDQALGQADMACAALDAAAHVRMQNWFNEQEATYDYLVYVGGARNRPLADLVLHRPDNGDPAAWTARCVQQADLILYVAWADSEPPLPSPSDTSQPQIEGNKSLQAAQRLVLLQPHDRTLPRGTHRWLDALNVDAHYHVGCSKTYLLQANDLGRLTRLLTGNGIGVVLSGGAARGFAHVGVMRALVEAQVPIDLIGGVSAGAIVAGMVAAGHDPASMGALVMATGQHRNMADYTLPTTAFFVGKRYSALMQSYYGDLQIEDAWQPYFCLSTDLANATEVVHTRGSLWKYVRASSGLPIALPPVADAGCLLSDGGILNNFPTEVMRNMVGCGTVIGVDVTDGRGLKAHYTYGTALSGWRQLLRRIAPWSRPLCAPGLSDTIMALSSVGGVGRLADQRRLVDLYIQPPVQHVTMLDYGRRAEIMDIGYRAAQPALKEWLATPASPLRQIS